MRSGVVAIVHLWVAAPRRGGAVAALALVLVLFVIGSAHAYRGQADLPELMSSGEVRFRDQQDISLEIHASLQAELGVSVGNAVQDAAASWAAVACVDIGFRVESTSSPAVAGDGHNTLALIAHGWSAYDVSPATIAITDIVYAQRPDGGLDIIEADVLFNDEHFDFAVEVGDEGLDFKTVLRHEFGHLLGLAHCCELDVDGELACAVRTECAGSLMHPAYDVNASVALGTDDVRGICHVYTPASCAGGCAEGEACILGRCRPITLASCGRDADCDDGDRCLEERCVPEAPFLGDPCGRDAECGSDQCADEGFCTVSCSGTCAAGYDCDGRQLCVPHGVAFGDACDQGDVCASGICLVSDAVCTRECSLARLCPVGFTCSEVGTTHVCAASGHGCSAVPVVPRTAVVSPLALLAALGIVTRRRRSHRGHHHEGT